MGNLSEVVAVDPEKCVNCHACISACPVKFCNVAEDDYISIRHDLCIGCGQCIHACTHGARIAVDDFRPFINDAKNGAKMVAIVAPAVASNFKNRYLHLNGWMKSLGIQACFDVSFGAELTVKSYLEHIKQNNPKCVIAQPCPAIVNYIEIYRPELIEYLAPADSPMLHTIKMIKEFYPQYSGHRVVVISPCVAKKREFVATGFGDYNVTMASINAYLDANRISLSSFEAVEYDNPPAERAVLFSTPGGLLRTAERWSADIRDVTRKIEGPDVIYPYLDNLKAMIDSGEAPLLIDCLNCEAGCNGGTGTCSCSGTNQEHSSFDKLENPVEERQKQARKKYSVKGFLGKRRTKKKLEKLIDKYWKNGLYDRRYENRSANNDIAIPNASEIGDVYLQLSKSSNADIYNCSACGYNSCENMAIAIFNGLNKPIYCHHHVMTCLQAIAQRYSQTSTEQSASMEEASAAMTEIESQTSANAKNSEESAKVAAQLRDAATQSATDMETLDNVMKRIQESGGQITRVVKLIDDIAFQTNLLALNAAVEAARAGRHGKGFAVVAEEVRNLANRSAKAAHETAELVQQSTKIIDEGNQTVQHVSAQLSKIRANAEESSQLTEAISDASQKQAIGAEQVSQSLQYIEQSLQSSVIDAEQLMSRINP